MVVFSNTDMVRFLHYHESKIGGILQVKNELRNFKMEPKIPPEKKLKMYKTTTDKLYDDESGIEHVSLLGSNLSDGCKMRTKIVRCSACTVKNT